jgi:hypothetical protein
MRMHDKHQQPSKTEFKEIIEVEKSAFLRNDEKSTVDFQRKQFAAWRRQRINCQPWLITDLVTLGSPLAYADFLIADNKSSFNKLKEDRILPTCPPQTESCPSQPSKDGRKIPLKRMTYELDYIDPLSKNHRTFTVFNHGAPFGVTRWTNLYFESKYCGLSGDIIGGGIKETQLGKGVRNVSLDSPWKGFSHTFYWRKKDSIEWYKKHFQALLKTFCFNSNTPPVVTGNNQVKTEPNTPANGNVLVNDLYAAGDPLTVTQFSIQGIGTFNAGTSAEIPDVGALLINPDGSYIFTPNPDYDGPVRDAIYIVSHGTKTDKATLSFADVPKKCKKGHIEELHDALHLNSRYKLANLQKKIPAFALLPKLVKS